MAILETLRNSKLLKHEKPVLILMYPSRLARCVRPGKKLRLFHGHNGAPMNELIPMADYALRTGFAKNGVDLELSPMLFSTTNIFTASAYSMKRSIINDLRRKKPLQINDEVRYLFREAFNTWGCIHVHELKIPHRFNFSGPRVERLANESLKEIVAVVNYPVSPIKVHTEWSDALKEMFSPSYPHPEQDLISSQFPEPKIRELVHRAVHNRFMSQSTNSNAKIPEQKIPIRIR